MNCRQKGNNHMEQKTIENSSLQVLCLEDSSRDAEIIHELLTDAGYDLNMDWTATEKEYVSFLRSVKYDIILSDFKLPGFDAFHALQLSIDICPVVPFICVSGSIGEETAIELVKKGAVDYVLKDRMVRLPFAIKRALDEVKEKEARRQAEDERKKAEDALREYSIRLEEMVEERTRELRDAHERLLSQEKLAVLGQLAGGVGHELRNPLGAIKNASYYLNMVLKESAPEVKEALQILEREVAASESIISSLLDFALPKPPNQRQVEIGLLLQKVLPRIPIPSNIEVVLQVDETLPDISADSDQLSQVFRNIILNAVQSMPGGGKLVVTAKIASTGQLDISISDTGEGIQKENIEKIFEPLFTTKAKGIGLGLAITRMLLKAHGGILLLQSEPGKGSVFTVRLPAGTGEVK